MGSSALKAAQKCSYSSNNKVTGITGNCWKAKKFLQILVPRHPCWPPIPISRGTGATILGMLEDWVITHRSSHHSWSVPEKSLPFKAKGETPFRNPPFAGGTPPLQIPPVRYVLVGGRAKKKSFFSHRQCDLI